jgi:hypothetical protein
MKLGKRLFLPLVIVSGSLIFSAIGGWLLSRSYCNNGTYREMCNFPLYPYWEYLSWRHSNQFFDPIKQDVEQGCLTEPATSIKVMRFSQQHALVWFKSESGSTWLARFDRPNHAATWSGYDMNQRVCRYDIIKSTMGGSADNSFWYN